MARRGENIYKRKDGRWEGRHIKGRTDAGKAVYGYIYAHTYKEAQKKLLCARQAGDILEKKSHVQQEEKFQALAEHWFCNIRPMIKESTYMKYRNLWKFYIQPKFGELGLSQITQRMLQDFGRELLVSGGNRGTGLSAKTVSDTMCLFRSIFRFGSANGIPFPCDMRALTAGQPAKEMRVFSLEEQQALCSRIYSDLCMPNVGILVCLFTGIRVGELCALKWEDISFSEKTLYVHQTMQRIQIENKGETEGIARTKVIVTTPKSQHSVRTIPLPDELLTILKSVSNSGLGYFLTGSETKWMEPRTMQNHFKRLLKNCTVKDANYHALRHTFATRCIEMGFDIKSLSEILGHATVTITMNRYVHPSMQLKRENMQRLSGMLAPIE